MNTLTDPRVLDAERSSSGVVIVFSDGMCALYSHALLYRTLSQAQDLSHHADFFKDDLESPPDPKD